MRAVLAPTTSDAFAAILGETVHETADRFGALWDRGLVDTPEPRPSDTLAPRVLEHSAHHAAEQLTRVEGRG